MSKFEIKLRFDVSYCLRRLMQLVCFQLLSNLLLPSSSCIIFSTLYNVCCIFLSPQRTSHLLLCVNVHRIFYSLRRVLRHPTPRFNAYLVFFFQSACAKSSNLSVCVSLLLLLHNVRCIVFSKYKCVASYTCTPSTRDAKRETDAVAIVLRV